MSIGLIGKKIGMSQVFEKERAIPVTMVEAGPCVVLGKKEAGQGLQSIQLGFGETKKANKPLSGYFKKLGVSPCKVIKEFKAAGDYDTGQIITASLFNEGECVSVSGTSKGKGFAGGMKRWGFHGGPASHGAEKWHRRPGSIGQSADPSRVFKGTHMAGRMGFEKVTVKNLKVIKVEAERNILMISGAIPGPNGSYVIVKKME